MTELQTPYDGLIVAAKSLPGNGILADIVCMEDFEKVAAEQSESFVSTNRGRLNQARDALQDRCSISLRYEESYLTEQCENWELLRRLVRAFSLELGYFVAQGNAGHAARIGLDILDVANVLRRGGLINDYLMGNLCESVGLDQLRRLRFQLADADRRMLIRELPRLEADKDPFADVMERDRKWDAAVNLSNAPLDLSTLEMDPKEFGISLEDQREFLRCLQAMADAPDEVRHARDEDSYRVNVALLRMLVVDLALRSYRAANRCYPDELVSLVPVYLDTLPLDPFTEWPFLYQRQFTDRFVLYSTGPGRVNHGATFGPLPLTYVGDFDLCLDTSDYENACCELEAPPRGMPGLVLRLRDAWTRWIN